MAKKLEFNIDIDPTDFGRYNNNCPDWVEFWNNSLTHTLNVEAALELGCTQCVHRIHKKLGGRCGALRFKGIE